MYIVKAHEALRNYLDGLANVFPKWFKPDPKDYNRKVMTTISRVDSWVSVEIVSFTPRLTAEVKLGGSISVNGHEVESGEKKMLVHSIVSDLVAAIDVISPRDKEVIAFHPIEQ